MKNNVERRMVNEEEASQKYNWSKQQRNQTLKSIIIPGYTLYGCYRDACENPNECSKFDKFLERTDPTLFQLELMKGIVYTGVSLTLLQYI